MVSVYVLQSQKNGRHYVGVSRNVEVRLRQHDSGKVKSTRFMRPLEFVYAEAYEDYATAHKRELYLKGLKSSRAIRRLIAERGPVAQPVRAQS